MLTYIVTESGAMEADMAVMTTAPRARLTNHVHEGVWEPVDTPEELFWNDMTWQT